MTRQRVGFTLIELLIVVAIIGILAAIAVVNYLNAQIRTRLARTTADMRTIATAMESYKIDNDSYPPTAGQYELTTPISYITMWPKSVFDEPGMHKDDGRYWGGTGHRNRWENRKGNAPCFLLTTGRASDPRYNPPINITDSDRDGRNDDLQIDMLYMLGIPMGWKTFRDVPSSVQWNTKSVGPNGKDDRFEKKLSGDTPSNLVYDPTNGLRSDGDVLFFGPGWGPAAQ